MGPDAERPSDARAWASLAILLLLNVLGFIDRSIIALLVQPIRHSLAITDVQIGLLQGFAFALFYALFGIPIAWALDRYPKRPIIFAGVFCWSLATAACGLAADYGHLLAARALVGVGEATLVPGSYAMIALLFRRERLGMALATFSLGASIGIAIAMFGGGAIVGWAEQLGRTLPSAPEGWRLVFLITGLPGLALAFLIFLVPDLGHAAAAPSGDAGLGHFLRTRSRFLICHFAGFSVLALMALSIAAWLPTWLIRIHGWTAAQAGAGAGFTALFAPFGVLASGAVVDQAFRNGARDAHMRYQFVATLAATVIAVAGLLVRPPLAALTLIGLAVALLAMTGIAAGALQLATPQHLRARISAIYLLAVSVVGSGGGPLVPALFTEHVFHDDAKLAYSIIATILVFAPVSLICFALGRGAMRAAIAELEASPTAGGRRP